MAGSMESLTGPNYVSSHSADVILSDVRPIKLKLEALRAVNVLLDEFLYTILSTAGSLATDKLKNSLNKILPTSLGKDAVLEAEMELKSYWERNTPRTPTKEDFDLQWSFELLRLKCEAYTTMNDLDEDEEAERRLGERMIGTGSLARPHNSLVAPAALYLTAILEHICEHILSNVSRVAARDSSRTVATAQDLFVALCEDASVYSMFQKMKVYDQIDALSKVQKPRRSKSMSRSGSLASRAASPEAVPPREQASSPPPRVRASSESGGSFTSAVLAAAGSTRSSHERSRKKLFGRSSIDQDRSPDVAEGLDDDTINSNSFEMMDEAEREFDELMQSTTTMKVSLTPDRLKTMEVYKQERRRPKTSESDPFVVSSAEVKRAVSVRRVQARLVDSITEDEEPIPIKAPPSPLPNHVVTPRARQTSLNATSAPTPMSNPRMRSITISAPQALQKKPSQSRMRPPVPPPMLPPKRDASMSTMQSVQEGRPQRTRRIARNRESLDLDEVMGAEDEETETMPQTPASRRDPSRPYISKTARDLIDFLDEGPPMEMQMPHRNASMISLESSKSRSGGRLHRMMSKLTLGGSSERLNPRDGRGSTAESIRSYRSPTSSAASSPPPSYMQSPVSLRGPTVIVATPPPPPQTLPLTMSLSSYMTQEPAEMQRQDLSPQTPSRRTSITRKPVPAWDEKAETLSINSQSTAAAPMLEQPPPGSRRASPNRKSSSSKRASPLDAFPPVPTTVNVNGIVHDSDSDIVRTASLASSKRYTPVRSEFPSPSSPHHSMNAPPSPSASMKRVSMRYAPSLATSPGSPTATCLAYDAPAEPASSWPPTPPSSNPDAPLQESAPVSRSTSEQGVSAETPAFTAEQAQDLRRLLSVATTADECRLLVDMFLCKSGFPLPAARDGEPTLPAATPEVERAAARVEAFNSDIERSLVALLLGDGEADAEDAEGAVVPAA